MTFPEPAGAPCGCPTAQVLDTSFVTVYNEDADSVLVLHLHLLPWVMGRLVLVEIGRQLEGQIIEILIFTKMYLHNSQKSEKNNKYHIMRWWDTPLDKCMLRGLSYCSRKVVIS